MDFFRSTFLDLRRDKFGDYFGWLLSDTLWPSFSLREKFTCWIFQYLQTNILCYFVYVFLSKISIIKLLIFLFREKFVKIGNILVQFAHDRILHLWSCHTRVYQSQEMGPVNNHLVWKPNSCNRLIDICFGW